MIVPQSTRRSQIIFPWVGGFSFALARRFVSLFRVLWQRGDEVVIACGCDCRRGWVCFFLPVFLFFFRNLRIDSRIIVCKTPANYASPALTQSNPFLKVRDGERASGSFCAMAFCFFFSFCFFSQSPSPSLQSLGSLGYSQVLVGLLRI